jgi:hypothetical protein
VEIGLIDADLIDKGTNFPNLALLKLSGYHQEKGDRTTLLENYDDIDQYDHVYISKVFEFTDTPDTLLCKKKNVSLGGSGWYPENDGPMLPNEIEHHMPDYHLYDDYVTRKINNGAKRNQFADYLDYSIGFATRGCFRKCNFCINKIYNHAFRHSPVSEFFDQSRKYIYLWDDNVLAYKGWRNVFEELANTGRKFQFRQGMDIRLMTDEKARIISGAKYKGDVIFAFDNLEDKKQVVRGLRSWRKHYGGNTKLYILSAYESQDVNDFISIFERIRILMEYQCLPYIMRYATYKNSRWRGMYINLARWCNQPNIFKKMSFREFTIHCQETSGTNGICSTLRYAIEFEKEFPDVANKYFDMKFER